MTIILISVDLLVLLSFDESNESLIEPPVVNIGPESDVAEDCLITTSSKKRAIRRIEQEKPI